MKVKKTISSKINTTAYKNNRQVSHMILFNSKFNYQIINRSNDQNTLKSPNNFLIGPEKKFRKNNPIDSKLIHYHKSVNTDLCNINPSNNFNNIIDNVKHYNYSLNKKFSMNEKRNKFNINSNPCINKTKKFIKKSSLVSKKRNATKKIVKERVNILKNTKNIKNNLSTSKKIILNEINNKKFYDTYLNTIDTKLNTNKITIISSSTKSINTNTNFISNNSIDDNLFRDTNEKEIENEKNNNIRTNNFCVNKPKENNLKFSILKENLEEDEEEQINVSQIIIGKIESYKDIKEADFKKNLIHHEKCFSFEDLDKLSNIYKHKDKNFKSIYDFFIWDDEESVEDNIIIDINNDEYGEFIKKESNRKFKKIEQKKKCFNDVKKINYDLIKYKKSINTISKKNFKS